MHPTFTCLALVICGASAAAQGLALTSVHPERHALEASTATEIRASFNVPLDPASISSSSVRIFGRWSGVVPGSLHVNGAELRFVPDRPLFAGEHVRVTLSNAVRSAAGDPLLGGHAWSFWARAAPGSGQLSLTAIHDVRFPGEGLIQSYGTYAGDLNGDGWPDLSIPDEVANDVRVLTNDGCGGFGTPVVHKLPPSSRPSSNEGADLNGDGHTDLAVANILGDTVSVLLGDGEGGYEDAVTYPSGNQPRGMGVLDLEGDGDMDMAVACRNSSRVALYANAGDGTFGPANLIEAGGISETSIAPSDADGDGWVDLFVGNYSSQDVVLMRSNGAGGFSTSDSSDVGGPPWMLASGDVNLDGFVDVVSCNAAADSISLVRSDGVGGLSPALTVPAKDYVLAIDLGDLDGDGDLDIAASSYSDGVFTYWANLGSAGLSPPQHLPAVISGSCVSFVDHDRDGDVDLLGIDELTDQIFVYEQVNAPLPGVQPADCNASLRLNDLGGSGGFAGLPAHPLAPGATAFVGLSGPSLQGFALGVGTPLQPGLPLGDVGLLNALPAAITHAGFTDSAGQTQVDLFIPAGIPAGAVACFQAFVFDPSHTAGGQLTNPECGVIAP